MLKSIIFLVSIIIFTTVSCNPTKPSDICTAIDDPTAVNFVQVIYPAAGDTLTIGKSIQIQFKFEKNTIINSALKATGLLQYGLTNKNIFGNTSINVPATGQTTCAELPWTVGNEGTVIQDNQVLAVKLRLFDYDNRATIFHETGIFYIKK